MPKASLRRRPAAPARRITSGTPTATRGALGTGRNELLFDGTYRYAYDQDGNCTLRFKDPGDNDTTPGPNDSDFTVYQWDARGRLAEVRDYTDYSAYSGWAHKIIDYLYDTENRWIGENILSGRGLIEHETRFAYDGDQIILQFDEDCSESNANDQREPYAPSPLAAGRHGPAHGRRKGDGPERRRQRGFPADGPGGHDPRPGDNGDRRKPAWPTTWSTMPSATWNRGKPNSAHVECLFGYTGRPIDPAGTGLQNNHNRWYSPQAMRWISQDPLGYDAGDTNLYRYCGNSETDGTDPAGLKPNDNEWWNNSHWFNYGSWYGIRHAINYFAGYYQIEGQSNVLDARLHASDPNRVLTPGDYPTQTTGQPASIARAMAGAETNNFINDRIADGVLIVAGTTIPLSGPYDKIRVETSAEYGPHFHLYGKSGKPIYAAFASLKEALEQLPDSLRNNGKIKAAILKVLKK